MLNVKTAKRLKKQYWIYYILWKCRALPIFENCYQILHLTKICAIFFFFAKDFENRSIPFAKNSRVLRRYMDQSYVSSKKEIKILKWKSSLKQKKWSHFDLKNWVTGGTKIRPGIPSNWRIFESNWLDIEKEFLNCLSISSQFDSKILQWLGIPGRILVPPVTQIFRSKWLHFLFQCWGERVLASLQKQVQRPFQLLTLLLFLLTYGNIEQKKIF